MNKQELMQKIVTTAFRNKEGHIASAFSILDFMLCLHDKVIRSEDDFVLSKGHASLALYAVMLNKGEITEDEFLSFCQFNSKLGGHPSSRKLSNVKISTGSLGHGFPFAVGLALAKRMKGEAGNVYCLIGDGEANEGTIWESALLAGSMKLSNLFCVMDFNNSGERAIKLQSCVPRFQSFDWAVTCIDGHNDDEILKALRIDTQFPKFIELRTIKGKGCPVMENNPEWHHKQPSSQEELEQILTSIY